MPINYTNLFEDVGAFVEAANDFRDSAQGGALNVQSLLTNVQTVLSANAMYDVMSGTTELFESYMDSLSGWYQGMATKVEERLVHPDTVLEQLGGLGSDTSVLATLEEIFRDMQENTESVTPCVVTLGAVSADAGNTGNAIILLDKVLDGATEPGETMVSNPYYDGIDSELSVETDTFSLTCTTDHQSGALEGQETFFLESTPGDTSGSGWRTPSAGTALTLGTVASTSVLSDGDFELWTSDDPSSWTIDAGTAATHIFEETTAADVHRLSSALRFTGVTAQTDIRVYQELSPSLFEAKKRYLLSCFVKGAAGIASGTLRIGFASPSGATVPSEEISLDDTALAAQTSYGHEYVYLNMPDTLPDDLRLEVEVTGTLTDSESVRVDSLSLSPVEWFNGVNIAIIPGSTNAILEDRWNFTVTNDQAGVFQTFFRRAFGVQLPSSGTPSISDALAT